MRSTLFALSIAASAAAWNLASQQPPSRHTASRAAAASMHGPSLSTATELRELRLDPEKAANLMEAQLDPQVAQGPFGKGGALEWVATLTDAWATLALAQLHFFDDDAVRDSSKNLQVLWSRALLAHNGQLQDPIAFQLLPKSTRWFINSGAIDFAAPWLEWIQAH